MRTRRFAAVLACACALVGATSCGTSPDAAPGGGTEAAPVAAPAALSRDVVCGDERFGEYLPLLEGKRVALFSNHTGIVGDEATLTGREGVDTHFGLDADGNEVAYGEHVLDALVARGVDVVAVFSPEHGFRGTEDAGATVGDSVDERTGVPIRSLYADEDTKRPADEDMAAFDALVVDMQDVGLRFYTYYLSLFHLMDACADAGKQVVVLDRPNPNGFYVDGPILRDAFRSNVGELPIPIVYGMTWGELARMINGEGWLGAGAGSLDLTVVPCQNYTHQTKAPLVRNPSPNLKDMRAVYLYASVCLLGNTQVSVGRGTDFPFEAYGSPHFEGMGGFGFSFTPRSMPGALEPPFLGRECFGVDLRDVPMEDVWDAGINLDYLVDCYDAYLRSGATETFWGTPDARGRYWVDKLSGSDELRLMVEQGKGADEIKATWQGDVERFREQRRPYLLYDE